MTRGLPALCRINAVRFYEGLLALAKRKPN